MSNTPTIEGAKMLTLLADLIIAALFGLAVYLWTEHQAKRDANNPYVGGDDYFDLDGPEFYDYDEEVILYDGDEYKVIEHPQYGRYATSSQGIGSEDNIVWDYGYDPRDFEPFEPKAQVGGVPF